MGTGFQIFANLVVTIHHYYAKYDNFIEIHVELQLFILDYFFFLEKFKFKYFSAHNSCDCVVRVQNIFSKILILASQQKNKIFFSVNFSIETRVEAFLDRYCPMDVALCLSCVG